jgi:predicted DNA repair protein MutK
MSVGLIALLDDVAALAKVAAASLDDVAAQATKAGSKAIGVVIDDAAVTPRYVTGFSAARELPIIGKIALGSLKNKLLILLPAALLLSLFLPGAITPLLMIGGVYLCYEGVEKIYEALLPHAAHAHEAEIETVDLDARSFEDQKVSSAVKTDFILSAEIMAITLAALPEPNIVTQAVVLAVVGIGITALVYGGVALIVKADDFGLMLARSLSPGMVGATTRGVGRALVGGMPYFLKILGVVGTAAMIWVGGGIVVHGLERYGFPWLAHLTHDLGGIPASVPVVGPILSWLAEAAGSGVLGIVIGFVAIPVMSYIVSPAWRQLKSIIRARRGESPRSH